MEIVEEAQFLIRLVLKGGFFVYNALLCSMRKCRVGSNASMEFCSVHIKRLCLMSFPLCCNRRLGCLGEETLLCFHFFGGDPPRN